MNEMASNMYGSNTTTNVVTKAPIKSVNNANSTKATPTTKSKVASQKHQNKTRAPRRVQRTPKPIATTLEPQTLKKVNKN